MCTSYSSTLHRTHIAYGFNFTDKEELPLPNNAFETVKIGKNMRGLISDVNIYSNYFDEKTMVKWTTSCDHPPGICME